VESALAAGSFLDSAVSKRLNDFLASFFFAGPSTATGNLNKSRLRATRKAAKIDIRDIFLVLSMGESTS
jgi:hypothetical protein